MNFLSSDEELEKLVRAFEAGQLAEGQWHHQEHIAICFWYLCRRPLLEAIFSMKIGILKYNERYNVQQTPERGYHETITLFFIRYLQNFKESIDLRHGTLVDHLRPLLRLHCESLPLLWQYYSKPVLNSLDARIQWVEPDLRSLPEKIWL